MPISGRGEGELGPHLTQCRLGRGLPLCQVASWSVQPFGHNTWAEKCGGCCAPILGRAGFPSNTMSPKPRPTSIPSDILIHPVVWSQQTWANPLFFWGGVVGSPSNTLWPEPRPTSMPSFILINPTVWPQYTSVSDRQKDRRDNSSIA